MERKVKGTIMKLVINGIKSDKINKDKYENILSDEAKSLLEQKILISIWYPYETYKECYEALGNILAKKNKNVMIGWGHRLGQETMSTIYKNIIKTGDLDSLVDMYPRFHRLLFNFGGVKLERPSENELIVTNKDFDPNFECWFYTSIGWMQKAIEMCLNKKVHYVILKENGKEDDVTHVKFTWASLN